MRLTEEVKLSIIKKDSEGMPSRKIAEELGLGKSTVGDFLRKDTYVNWWSGRDNKENCYKAHRVKSYSQEITPEVTVKVKVLPEGLGTFKIETVDEVPEGSTHFVIPDTQVKPGVDLSYCSWVGKYLADKRPAVIVHIGDHADMPSLSSYDKGTKKAEGKRINEDFEAAIEGMRRLLGPIYEVQQKQLKEDGKISYKPKMVIVLGNHECLHPATEVATKSGFKLIEEVTTDDEVLTMNEEGQGEWHKPSLLFSKEYDGDLYEWSSNSFNVKCTENHRMYYKTSSDKVSVTEAKSMCSNFKAITATSSKGCYTLSDEYLSLSAWLCTDSYFTKGNQVILYQRESNAHKIRDLLNSLGVSFKEGRRERGIKEICGKVLKKKPEAGIDFTIDKQVASDLKVFSNKVLPEWVGRLSDSQWDTFLETLIEADGSIPTRSNRSRVFYGKKAICDDIQLAAITHGWSASITEYRVGHFRVNLTQRSDRRQEGKTPTVTTYKGKVYCLEIPNSNFMIRSGNKCHITGNCRIMRHVNANPELAGFISYDNLKYKDFGWEVSDFLVPYNIHGVNYVHYMANPMSGKPYGGAALNILNKVGETFVMGHKQCLDVATRFLPASGRQQWAIIAGACYTFDEDYKGPQGNKHWRGVVILHNVKDGNFNLMTTDLTYLEGRYGK